MKIWIGELRVISLFDSQSVHNTVNTARKPYFESPLTVPAPKYTFITPQLVTYRAVRQNVTALACTHNVVYFLDEKKKFSDVLGTILKSVCISRPEQILRWK